LKNSRPIPLFLAVLAGLLFLPALGTRDFWAPVEPRYAEIARVMLSKGEWILPTVNGELYTDKPILYFWLVLIGSKLLGGVNEWSARLPSALSAMGLVLTTYFLGRDLLSPRAGFLGAIILATSARVLWEGRWAHTDMPFTFFFALSLYFFSRVIFQKGNRRELLWAYGLMGLATLAKGLIGAVLPGLILLSFLAVRRDWRSILEWRLPAGILLFLLITTPWFAAVSIATGGRWMEEFILVHHIQRYAGSLRHEEPFYYYFLNFPLDFLPWTIFAVPAIFVYRSRLRLLKEPLPLFLLLWFSVVFLFFSLSESKRALYLLPLFPPAALFVARYFEDLVAGNISQTALFRWLALLFFVLLCLGSFGLPVAVWFLQREMLGISLPFAAMMAGGGLVAATAIWRHRPSMAFTATACTAFLSMLYLAVWILPLIDQYKSPRAMALLIKKEVPPNDPLYIYMDTMNDFNFYTGRERIPVLFSPAEIKNAGANSMGAHMLIRERDFKKVNQEELTVVAEGRVGAKRWYLTKFHKSG